MKQANTKPPLPEKLNYIPGNPFWRLKIPEHKCKPLQMTCQIEISKYLLRMGDACLAMPEVKKQITLMYTPPLIHHKLSS